MLSQSFGLDLIGSVVDQYGNTIIEHPEQIDVLRVRLVPLITRIITEKSTFPSAVRATRLLQFIVSRLLFAMPLECELALQLVNHTLEQDSGTSWKRVLFLEMYRNFHEESALIRNLYSNFDENVERRNIVRDHLAALVRLASEKPTTIGLGQQTSVPESESENRVDEEAAVQAAGVVGTIGATATTTGASAPGITSRWSVIKTPCIDVLDKSEAPALPPTYIYSLVLSCINYFSEGLGKFLLPFTVPLEGRTKRKQRGLSTTTTELSPSGKGDGEASSKAGEAENGGSQKRKIPTNPLTLKDHVLYSQIYTSSQMIEHCWPAILATCSTFLNATLDSDNYHNLIRSFQKFTHVAGILELPTPRDAFLTTLGKHAVPRQHSILLSPKLPNALSPSSHESDQDNPSDRDTSPARSDMSGGDRQQKASAPTLTITSRNLLCLRALLNLGTALGPVLQNSWSIILETYQQADSFIPRSGDWTSKSRLRTSQSTSTGDIDIAGEISAVETAASRLLDSTKELPDTMFLNVLRSLRRLLHGLDSDVETDLQQSQQLLSPEARTPRHNSVPSLSRPAFENRSVMLSNLFALERLGQVALFNRARLTQQDAAETGWDILLETFISVLSSSLFEPDTRIKAAEELLELGTLIIVHPEHGSEIQQDVARCRGLEAFSITVASLSKFHIDNVRKIATCEIEIHRMALEKLHSVLERCGESLRSGWQVVLDLIASIFNRPHTSSPNVDQNGRNILLKSPKLVKPAFTSLQLIHFDFLSSVPRKCFVTMLDASYYFSAQVEDLNSSLTVSAFAHFLVID